MCLSKTFANFNSLADGIRTPPKPLIVEAPYGELIFKISPTPLDKKEIISANSKRMINVFHMTTVIRLMN